MNKRILVTFLWFNVGWTTGAMATFFLGMPAGLDVALAVASAAFFWLDPMHKLWTSPTTRRIAQRPEELQAPSRLAHE